MTRAQTRMVILAGTAVVAIILLYYVRGVLTPFVLAGIITYLLSPLVNALERKQVSRSVAVLLVYLSVGVAGFLLVVAVVPQLTSEVEDLLQALPQQKERFDSLTQRTAEDFQRIQLPATLQEMLNSLLRRAEALLETFALRTAEFILGLLSRIVSLVLAPILAFYLLRDWERLRERFLNNFSDSVRLSVVELARDINHVLHNFIRGQLVISLVVAVLATIGLTLLQIPYALLIGVIAGLFNIIPYFGAIIGAVPGVALGLLQSPQTALGVVIMFVLIHQFEGAVLSPRIMGDYVGLHPLVVIFAILAGAEFMGIFGMLLAVPIVAALRVIGGFVGPRLLS